MRLVFAGTGGYHPNSRRHTMCLILPEAGVVFDAGTAFFRIPDLATTEDLDIFLTHAHLDHIFGLTFLIPNVLSGQFNQVRVHAKPKYLDAVRNHLLARPLFPVDIPGMEFSPLQESHTLRDGGRLTHCPLVHPGGSTGYRIDWPGKSLGFITDTTAPGDYIDFIRDVDVLIHECYFPDDNSKWSAETGHSNTSPVLELAREANVGRLLLVHSNPQTTADDPIELEQTRHIFPNVEIAEDLQEIEF